MSLPFDITRAWPTEEGGRYATRPLYQVPRRDEPIPSPAVVPVGTGSRSLIAPDGNPSAPWLTMGQPVGEEPRATLHQYPYGPVPGPEATRHYPGTLDYLPNAHLLRSQLVPESAGLGASIKRMAGLDFLARIYSVKRWSMASDVLGADHSGSWAAGNSYSFLTAAETGIGDTLGRGLLPTELSYFFSDSSEENDSSRLINLALQWPYADVGSAGYSATLSFLGAGMDAVGDGPIICPTIWGSLTIRERNAEGEETTNLAAVIRPGYVVGTGDVTWTPEPLPITICGYQIVGWVESGKVGTPGGTIEIGAEEFRAAGEWSA